MKALNIKPSTTGLCAGQSGHRALYESTGNVLMHAGPAAEPGTQCGGDFTYINTREVTCSSLW